MGRAACLRMNLNVPAAQHRRAGRRGRSAASADPGARAVVVARTSRSGRVFGVLEPLKTVARSIRTHQTLILNWFAAKKESSAGIVEGLNDRVKPTIRKAYGVRTLEAAEIALYHALGRRPEPTLTPEFC